MVRHRVRDKSSDSGGEHKLLKRTRSGHKQAKPWFPKSLNYVVILVLVAGIAYYAYQGYLETRVYTPLKLPPSVTKTGLNVPEKFWGSYRPGVYFGLKTRSPADLLTGLMWMVPELIKSQNLGLRHWCEQGDNLDSFGWKQHDGENFGVQEISDRGLKITTSFVKRSQNGQHGGEWSARISAEAIGNKTKAKSITLFFYAGMDEGNSGGQLRPLFGGRDANQMTGIVGSTNSLDDFTLTFSPTEEDSSNTRVRHVFHATADSPGPHKFTETVMQRLRLYQHDKLRIIGLDPTHLKSDNPNFVVYQVNAMLPFQLDVVFKSNSFDQERDDELSGEIYTKELSMWRQKFDARFEDTFGLRQKGYDQKAIEFAHSALSNMIGGIGYFYGHSLVQSELTKRPVRYWDAGLYTAVPSRSFFPRGFLWDEGFHNLLISKWSKEMSADIVAHWLDLINVEGWIPREQILGNEARAKVPAEFVVQHNKNANPPTLLLTLHSMVRDLSSSSVPPQWFANYLHRIWARLEVWYNWFDTTQAGKVPGTYRWRGRNGSAIHELNPKTLTSGLDDFPRASHPTDDERHVDLRCWLALASSLMADIAHIIGKTDEANKYRETASFLNNNALLDNTHWSQEHKAYLDFGLHTEGVVLQRPRPPPGQKAQLQKERVVTKEPRLQFVNQFGYVSLFPFLLQILDPSSPNLGQILKDIDDPSKLWTPYGLRSLSKDASLYMKRNTEHDAPYWRGPIWINANFLAVRALHYYGHEEGPFRSEAKKMYSKLRTAIVDNVMKQYEKTGYIWEQYNDKTGQGQGCKPFTGWSALVVLTMGENY